MLCISKRYFLLTLIIMCTLSIYGLSFAGMSHEAIATDNLALQDESVWLYEDASGQYYLRLYHNQEKTVDFAFEKVGSYQYFGVLNKRHSIYTLEKPCSLFSDLVLELEYDDSDLRLKLESETLDIKIYDAIFKRVEEDRVIATYEPEIEAGSDFFFTAAFKESLAKGQALYEAISQGLSSYDTLSKTEKDDYDLFYEHISLLPWQTQGEGCSWYCGVVNYDTKASSSLTPLEHNNYGSMAIHDFSLLTAWVEGEEGYGLGESVSIIFPSGNPRATSINIYNGYQKSRRSYYNNGRVKTLTLYINDQVYGQLKLEDSPRCQSFDIGLTSLLNSQNDLEFKFRIDEVYPGELYEDTAISEINFDGIDAH